MAISIKRNQSATSVGNGDNNFVIPLSQVVLTLCYLS